jgi:chromosomal replication initiator protein
VANFYRLPPSKVYSRCRDEHLTWPRHVAMYLVREVSDLTLEETAHCFKVHHGSIIHAVHKVKNRIATKRKEADAIGELKVLIVKKINEHL